MLDLFPPFLLLSLLGYGWISSSLVVLSSLNRKGYVLVKTKARKGHIKCIKAIKKVTFASHSSILNAHFRFYKSSHKELKEYSNLLFITYFIG